ncbi:MAG: helix-hairpin-helix domain-containing protein [Bacteroidales bacterium]|nr:helix-hairpin-helix domain-containing protein [Bacteroidales bacterium]
MKTLYSLVLLIFFIFPVFSQDRDVLSEIIENISANYEEEVDHSFLADQLTELYENPVYVNSCSEEDLARIPFLTEFQVKSLLDYVKEKGPVVSIYEIQYVYGYDLQMVRFLEPFLSLKDKTVSFKSQFSSPKNLVKNDVIILTEKVLQQKEGF